MNDDGTLQGRVNLDAQRLAVGEASARLRADSRAHVRDRPWRRGSRPLHLGGPRDHAGAALPACTSTGASSRSRPSGPCRGSPTPSSGSSRAATSTLDRLRELLPPERFALRGFMILKAVDVTDQEVLSSLKRDLIDKESIVSQRALRGPAGQAPDAVPPARPAPGPGRRGGRPRARPQRRHESRARLHLRRLGAPQDVRVRRVALRARRAPGPAPHHRRPRGVARPRRRSRTS